MSTPSHQKSSISASVRAMRQPDIATARSILSLAFGTFIGVPDPSSFAADKDYIGTRWKADPDKALVAELDGVVIGSNMVANWGSFGFFGPLTIKPEFWNQGVAQSLLGVTMDLFQTWGVREAGLFTFAQSGRHVHLYQKFGFWPRFLTAIMEKPAAPQISVPFRKYSEMTDAQRQQVLDACRALTHSIFDGLDVTPEIKSVYEQELGDTVLLWDGDSLDAFAICHCGEGTEAGANSCYLKFAAARPGARAEKAFEQLLQASEALAADRGLKRIEAGVNLARARAYRIMLQQGFRTEIQGVAMHRNDLPGFNRPDAYVVDDWR